MVGEAPMITDNERREVARRLRSFVTDDSVYADVDACRVLHSIGLYYKDIDRIYFSGFDVARLADLIEPPTQCPYYHSDRHYCSIHDVPAIDREALRALAAEMEQAGKDYRYQMVENACCDNLINDAPDDFIDYARRIREALGVDDA